MAVEQPGFTFTRVAAVDLSSHQFKFVKIDTTGRAVLCDAAGDAVGILQNKPKADQAATIMANGISKVIGAADLANGNLIGPDANGLAAVATAQAVGRVLGDNTTANGMCTVLFSCLSPQA